jgi:hypothetical protein
MKEEIKGDRHVFILVINASINPSRLDIGLNAERGIGERGERGG